jgi:glycosyltransferase 2 family protein
LWLVPIGALFNVGILFSGHVGLGRLPRIAHPELIVFALVLALVDWVTNSLRLRMWSRFTGHPLVFLACLRIFLGGILASAATPTATGATVFKGLFLAEEGVPGPAAVSLVAIETVEDILFFLLFLPVAFALGAGTLLHIIAGGQLDHGLDAMLAVLLVLVATVLLLRVTWIAAARGLFGGPGRSRAEGVRGIIARTWEDVVRVYGLIVRRGKARFVLGMLLTTIQWSARYSVATLVVAALGGPFRLFLFGGLQWLVFTFATVVPTPGGTGALEAAFALFYAPFLPLPLSPRRSRFGG